MSKSRTTSSMVGTKRTHYFWTTVNGLVCGFNAFIKAKEFREKGNQVTAGRKFRTPKVGEVTSEGCTSNQQS